MRIHTLRHSRKVKLLTALAVLGLAGALSGLAAAGSSPVSDSSARQRRDRPRRQGRCDGRPHAIRTDRRSAAAGPAAAPAFTPDPIPAGILDANVPVPISSSIITETNGWLVSNGYNLVAVYAGSKGRRSDPGARRHRQAGSARGQANRADRRRRRRPGRWRSRPMLRPERPSRRRHRPEGSSSARAAAPRSS